MFVPDGFEAPTSHSVGEYRLEPLGPQHNERDYAAWTSSMEHIRSMPGYPDGRWPREMSLADNLKDLERHSRDFAERNGFTYTVLDRTDDVVGCVYIYPCRDDVHDARVKSWLRASKADHEPSFRQGLADWLVSDAWPFERPLYEPLLGTDAGLV